MNVAVVGAGIVGYAIAYELAARGAHVQILDRRGSGLGATRASAGMLAPYIEGHSPHLLRLGILGLACYDDFIERVEADAGLPVEYRRIGTLQVAVGNNEAAMLEQHAGHLAKVHVRHQLLSRAEIRRMEPGVSNDAHVGLLIPEHGYVGVRTLMGALESASLRRGATFREAAVSAVSNGTGVTLSLDHGAQLACDAVVLAAGCWSDAIVSAPNHSIVHPVRGQLLELRVPPRTLSHVIWGSHCYLVPWADGTVLVGATMENVGFDERTTPEGIAHLRAASSHLAPALAEGEFIEARAGLRPATADELPIVGPSSRMPGVFYATGHFRNGVLLAPLTAKLLADMVMEGRQHEALAIVRPDRVGL